MHTIKTEYSVEVKNKIGCKDANEVIAQICKLCHDGLIESSMTVCECDDNPYLNTAKNWRETCEGLEGILCEILELLGD